VPCQHEQKSYDSLENVVVVVVVACSAGGFRQLSHLEVQEELFVASRRQQFLRIRTKSGILKSWTLLFYLRRAGIQTLFFFVSFPKYILQITAKICINKKLVFRKKTFLITKLSQV
jgi:hypothetical protein